MNNAKTATGKAAPTGTATKTDWTDRFQQIFKRKYDLGYAKGHSDGYDKGFLDGSRKAIIESRKVYIKRIEKEIAEVSSLTDIEFLDGLNRAIDLIKAKK